MRCQLWARIIINHFFEVIRQAVIFLFVHANHKGRIIKRDVGVRIDQLIKAKRLNGLPSKAEPVNDTALQRGIGITGRHADRCSARRLNNVASNRRRLANTQTFHISWCANRFINRMKRTLSSSYQREQVSVFILIFNNTIII